MKSKYVYTILGSVLLIVFVCMAGIILSRNKISTSTHNCVTFSDNKYIKEFEHTFIFKEKYEIYIKNDDFYPRPEGFKPNTVQLYMRITHNLFFTDPLSKDFKLEFEQSLKKELAKITSDDNIEIAELEIYREK